MKFGAASAGDSGSTRIRTGANPPPVSLEMNGRAGMNCPGYDLEGSSPRASSRGGRVQFPPRTRRSSNKALLEQGAPLLGTTWNPHGSTLCGGYRRFPQVTWWLLHVGSCWVRSDNGVMKRNSQAGGVEASATLVHLGCWCAEVWKGRRFDVKGDKMLKRTNNKHQPMRAGSSRRTPHLGGADHTNGCPAANMASVSLQHRNIANARKRMSVRGRLQVLGLDYPIQLAWRRRDFGFLFLFLRFAS
jgi:hypothetical protein